MVAELTIFICCICIQVVELFKAIEVVVRRLLNVKSHVLGNSEIHAGILEVQQKTSHFGNQSLCN